MISIKEQSEQLVSAMTEWEVLEGRSAESIRQVKAKCGNPLICLIMDIIENDAATHKRLQEFIASSLERKPINLSLEEVGEVIELIREHTRLKGEMITKAESMLDRLSDKSLRIQKFLLRTLIADEKKHQEMLEGIEEIRKGLYPYWPH